MTEVDFYAWMIGRPGMPSHRLTLRKRILDGAGNPTSLYEVYRKFPNAWDKPEDASLGGLKSVHDGEQIIFTSPSLNEAVQFANVEVQKHHPEITRFDEICLHTYPKKSSLCKTKA